MEIDRSEVKHLAQLSRLSLSDDEINTYGHQLGAILGYASHLPELDATAEPSHLRVEEDTAVTPEHPHRLLRNALAVENGYVKVPAILDKSES